MGSSVRRRTPKLDSGTTEELLDRLHRKEQELAERMTVDALEGCQDAPAPPKSVKAPSEMSYCYLLGLMISVLLGVGTLIASVVHTFRNRDGLHALEILHHH